MTVKMRVDKIRMVMQNLITESFFEVVMKEVKHQLLSWLFQNFKVIFCSKAASYEVII
jgi:hypothetical protein